MYSTRVGLWSVRVHVKESGMHERKKITYISDLLTLNYTLKKNVFFWKLEYEFHFLVTDQGQRLVCHGLLYNGGVGIAQWLECRTHDWKVLGLSPGRSCRKIFFSMVNVLCWLLFWYLSHPCDTAVTHKRSRSFCQKCSRRLHLNTHTPYLCGFEWSDNVTWYMAEWCTQNLHRNGSISHGTSHATSTECYQNTTFMDINNMRYKRIQSLV